MSDYKSSILARFGIGIVEACFDDLPLKKEDKEKGTKAEVLPKHLKGFKLHIRKLPAGPYDAYIFKRMDPKTRELDFGKYPGLRAELVAMALCDPDGNDVFKSTEEANKEINTSDMKWVYELCQWVNGADAGAQEEAEKN